MEFSLTTKQKIILSSIIFLVWVNVLAWREVAFVATWHFLKVEVLDIGQGDSIFIQTPDRRSILVDGGPGTSVMEKLSHELPFWNKNLDVVILTHPDQDHLLGLFSVLERYKVDYIVWTGIVRDGANYQTWVNLLEKKKKEGSKIIFADSKTSVRNNQVLLTVIHPLHNLSGIFFGKADNDTGIVSHLAYGKNAFLLTADVSFDVEKELLKEKADISADVLKVAHHGSKYSSSEDFLQAVHPTWAAISVGKNNTYGHPTPEVLQKLAKFDIKTLRTDESGNITFLSDGSDIHIITSKP